jgi:hypothetical protein
LLRLNSTNGTTPQSAQLQARSDGGLSFQFGPTSGPIVEKLSIDNTGKLTFAPGQTFPGTQTLTSGTGISIVSNAINNTGVTGLAGTASQINVSASTGAVTLSLPATVGVNISGNAATATAAVSAGSATTAGTAINVGFSGITGSTNTTAAMVVGSGSSLSATGTGTINATQLGGFQIIKLVVSIAAVSPGNSRCTEQSFAIGLQASDVIMTVNPPSGGVDLSIGTWRNAGSGNLAMNICNDDSSAWVAPPSAGWIVVVLR